MEQHLNNNLSEGMHSDNDQNAQPDNTYREAWNGSIITLGGNRFAFETLKGTLFSFQIPDHYNKKPFQPIGWGSFVDALIVFSASDETSTKPGEIAKVTFNNDGTLATYTPLYYHESFNFSKEYPIPHDGIVCKPENGNIKRIVWTDNNSPLRTMNWADPKFTTTYASGTLVNGSKYMVLTKDASSYITYNAVQYGPGRAGGNIITANATSTYTLTGSNAWIIEYVPIENFDVIVDFAPGTISLTGYVSNGSLPEGDYQYAYQLETSEGGRSNWSYLSLPMSVVGNLSNLPTSQSISYAKYGSIGATNSGKGLKLNINAIDNVIYSKIRVAFVRKTSYGIYNDPEVFYYEALSSSSLDLIHYGNETAYEILSINDITTPSAILDLVKSISASKNILFAANVGLSPDPVIDLSDVQAKTKQYLMPGDILGGSPSTTNNIAAGYAIHGFGMVQNATTGQSYALPYQWHEVVSGSVTYNTVTYNTGDFFRGIPGITAITGTGKAVAVIRMQKYTSGTTLNAGNYRNIRIEEEFCNHKGLIPSHYLKSLWRKETYRYGIFFYGKKGQQNYVQWLIDKTIPAQYNVYTDTEIIKRDGTTAVIGFNGRLCEYNSATSVGLRALGMTFNNINFNSVASAYGVARADLDTVVKGFSIVRVERDAQIVSQGVLFPTVINGNETEALSTHDIQNDKYGAVGGRRPNYYVYHSPDDMYAASGSYYEGRPNKLAGDKLEIQDKYSPISAIDAGWLCVSDYNYYDKFYNQTGGISGAIEANGYSIDINIERTLYFGFGVEGISVPGFPGNVNNRGTCAAFLTDALGAIGEREWKGAPGVFVWTNTDETTYTDGFGRHQTTDKHKCIINWTRSKSNLYGGSSESVKANHTYLFCGHYQALDSSFMSYMEGTTESYPTIQGLTYYIQGDIIAEGTSLYRCITSYTTLAIPVAASAAAQWTLHQLNGTTKAAGIVNNVEVFGGDAFVSLFGFGRGVRSQADPDPRFSQGNVFPIESNLNPEWRASSTLNNKRFYHATESSTGLDYPGAPESFYVYPSLTGPERQYFFAARPQDLTTSLRDAHIILHSIEKIDGEIYDNWRNWRINNYKRVDGQYGAITNIVAKSSRLFYLQNKGVGYLPIFERQMQNSPLGDAIQMGVGGIMDRFDEIDYEIGNQHQMGLMVGQDAMVWFDWRRKMMMRLSFAGGKQPISLLKGLDSFFNTKFTEVESEAGNTIFNSENPLTGKGILAYFDYRLKMGIMWFKYNQISGSRTIEKDFGLLFNNSLDKYIAFYSAIPNHIIYHNGHLLMNRQTRPSIAASINYVVGDEITDTTNYHNYTCIVAFNSGGSPVQPSSNATNWVKTSQINEIYVNWRGEYCKFFGKVHEAYVSPILKTNTNEKIAIDNVEVVGNDTRFTDIYVSNSYQSGSDTDITSTNKNYDYVDGSWWFNIPFASNGARLSDSWMQIKLRVKNYVSNPTVAINTVKRIFQIKSSIRRKL